MAKYIIKGTLNGKRIQYSRDNLERAVGIAENYKSATIYEKRDNGLMPIKRVRNGSVQNVSIKDRLKLARKMVLRK